MRKPYDLIFTRRYTTIIDTREVTLCGKIACSVGATTGAAIVGSYLYTKLIKSVVIRAFKRKI